MKRSMHFALAALFAALLGAIGFAPARAAGLPAGPAIAIDQASKPGADQVRWVRRCGPYGCRSVWVGPRRHVGRPVYAGRPVYVRRCFTQRRMVWTAYGWRPRFVRVCR